MGKALSGVRSLREQSFSARLRRLLARLFPHIDVIVVILVGAAAAIAACAVVWLQVAAHQRTEFQWVAQDRNRALKKGIEDSLDAIRSLSDLLRVYPAIDREGFQAFSASILRRQRGIQSLEWLPRVTQGERTRHEAAGGQVEFGYTIAEHNPDGVDVPAGRRAEYFPVFFREPPAPEGVGMGFDRASDPMQRELIERAAKSGEMTVSGRIPLDPESTRFGVMVFDPVFEDGRGRQGGSEAREIAGFVVGVLCLFDLANASIALLEPRGVEFLIQDESAQEGEEFLDFYTSRLGPAPALVDHPWGGWSLPEAHRVTEVFRVADREWSITCARTPYYRSAEGFKQGPWIVLWGGMALTALMALFVYAMRREMNARLMMEQELQESEQKLRILFDQSPDIIVMVDENAKILIVNRPWPKAQTDSAVGLDSGKILPEGLQERYREVLNKVFRAGEVDRFQYSDPDLRWWEARVAPVRMGGAVKAAMVIATDVTERRLLEAQAIRTARFATLGVLAASVAHEINNPNSAIQFNASLLHKSFSDVLPILQRETAERGAFLIGGVPVGQALDALPRMLEGLVRNSQRIQNIVANLKHMARYDQGEYNQSVDLAKVLHSAYSILQHQIQKQTNHWELRLAEPLPSVRGNSQQLEQVFINLVLNALQALPHRSARLWVTAQTEPDGGQVRVSVVDQGNGIEDKDLQHIFDPFFTTHQDQGGTGLGLPICQRIVQNHGGTIEINSQCGFGTEVSVRLPAMGTV